MTLWEIRRTWKRPRKNWESPSGNCGTRCLYWGGTLEAATTVSYPQQEEPPSPQPSPQPQTASPPVLMLLMRAAAQPTPARTDIAPYLQFRSHAPHSMHRSISATIAFLSRSSMTSRGQTSRHTPQPVQVSEQIRNVDVEARYTIVDSFFI